MKKIMSLLLPLSVAIAINAMDPERIARKSARDISFKGALNAVSYFNSQTNRTQQPDNDRNELLTAAQLEEVLQIMDSGKENKNTSNTCSEKFLPKGSKIGKRLIVVEDTENYIILDLTPETAGEKFVRNNRNFNEKLKRLVTLHNKIK